jgi:membrane protein DedA with SNARE-associated domain
MQADLAEASSLLISYRELAGLLVGGLVLLECAAVLGVIFPATATMMTIGGMMGAGLLDAAVVVPSALMGAIVGGWLSYEAGRRLGPSVLRRQLLKRHRATAARMRLLFRRHGVPLVLAARFYAPARASVPLIAGVVGMRRRRFCLADGIAALLWSGTLFAVGSAAATGLDGVAAGSGTKIALFAALATMTSAFASIAARKLIGGGRRRSRGATI